MRDLRRHVKTKTALEECDSVVVVLLNDRFLPALRIAVTHLVAAWLAAAILRADLDDAHVPQLFDRLLDVNLVGQSVDRKSV